MPDNHSGTSTFVVAFPLFILHNGVSTSVLPFLHRCLCGFNFNPAVTSGELRCPLPFFFIFTVDELRSVTHRVGRRSIMHPQDSSSSPDPHLPTIKIHHPSSPRHPSAASSATPTAGARRKIGVAVDLSDESAFAVRWSVDHYIRPGDAVILVHVSPTSVLFGADWGPLPHLAPDDPNSQDNLQKSQEDFDAFTASKISDLARPLKDAQIPYKIHIVKDHDMRERLCLEFERLGLSAVIMGSRGFGAAKRGSDGKLGSVSDYCVHHCVCPVVVVRYPDDKEGGEPIVSVKPPMLEEDENEAAAAKPPIHEAADHKC